MATEAQSSNSSLNSEGEVIISVAENAQAQKFTELSVRTEEGSTNSSNDNDDALHNNSNVPHLSIPKLFWFFFFNFGLFSWGGPVAQIAMIRERLVVRDKWITPIRFQRVFSVYQVLPGPEATELCMFFGCLSAGKLGGVVAGIAFILPGFVLMILASYLYSLAGLENEYVNASFSAIQPIVTAMVLRAAHIIAKHSLVDHFTRKINPTLVTIALCTALNSGLHINIFISLGLYRVLYSLASHGMRIIALILFAVQYVVYGIYVHHFGIPSAISLALGVAKTPTLTNLFVLGLVAGCLSFGGAYTAIPIVQIEAVTKGAWLPAHVFLDCIAISNVLPAPLTIFVTFVGFQGGLVDGGLMRAFISGVVITIGVMAPCFIFTIAGHEMLEKLVRNKLLSTFFDGLCAAVIGVIAVIAMQILRSSVVDSRKPTASGVSDSCLAALLCLLALSALYKFVNKHTPLLLVLMGAIAGQFLFL